jgi:hypothetical protein
MINSEILKEYLEITNEVNDIKAKLKTLNERRTKLEKKILVNMEKENLENTQIETNKFLIDYSKKKSYQSISKGFLEEKIEKFFHERNNKNLTDELIEYIYESREIKETKFLKIKNKNKNINKK